MLTELCAELRNYFLRDYRHYSDIHRGSFVISGGDIESLDFLQQGQYFRIVGSVFNDGVWRYGEGCLVDEAFTGEVWAMTVPPAVIALDAEIDAWKAANKDALDNPYQSESFGGYSYSKASGASGTNANGASTSFGWQNQFAKRLDPYRRISAL